MMCSLNTPINKLNGLTCLLKVLFARSKEDLMPISRNGNNLRTVFDLAHIGTELPLADHFFKNWQKNWISTELC